MCYTLISLIANCLTIIECLPIGSENRVNVFQQVLYNMERGEGQISFPKDWPFSSETLNYITIVLATVVAVVVLFSCCCVCYLVCFRSQYDETLVVTPSELVAIGAKPSDLKAANITPSVLEESGATSGQMRQLGYQQNTVKQSPKSKEQIKSEIKSEVNSEEKPSPRTQRIGSTKVSKSPQQSKGQKSKEAEKNTSNLANKRSSVMSENVKLLANKLKDKPKKETPTEKEVPKQLKSQSTNTKNVPKPETKDEDNISTVSSSAVKKAAALKPLDDSMSTAMGPTEEN